MWCSVIMLPMYMYCGFDVPDQCIQYSQVESHALGSVPTVLNVPTNVIERAVFLSSDTTGDGASFPCGVKHVEMVWLGRK